jgi:hypothetical protein
MLHMCQLDLPMCLWRPLTEQTFKTRQAVHAINEPINRMSMVVALVPRHLVNMPFVQAAKITFTEGI